MKSLQYPLIPAFKYYLFLRPPPPLAIIGYGFLAEPGCRTFMDSSAFQIPTQRKGMSLKHFEDELTLFCEKFLQNSLFLSDFQTSGCQSVLHLSTDTCTGPLVNL